MGEYIMSGIIFPEGLLYLANAILSDNINIVESVTPNADAEYKI